MTLRVASLPSEGFDGDATVSFESDGLGSPAALDFAAADSTTSGDGSGDANGGESIAVQSLTSDAGEQEEEEEDGGAAASFDVSFYHCIAGNFWNSVVDEATGISGCASEDSVDTCCALCSDFDLNDVCHLCCRSVALWSSLFFLFSSCLLSLVTAAAAAAMQFSVYTGWLLEAKHGQKKCSSSL